MNQPAPVLATFEGQTVIWDGRPIRACHETVDALICQAKALAPRFTEETLESGCTNYGQLAAAGVRQRRAYALVAEAHAWNDIAGQLEERRDSGSSPPTYCPCCGDAMPSTLVVCWPCYRFTDRLTPGTYREIVSAGWGDHYTSERFTLSAADVDQWESERAARTHL
jgi:hypothetical protein